MGEVVDVSKELVEGKEGRGQRKMVSKWKSKRCNVCELQGSIIVS